MLTVFVSATFQSYLNVKLQLTIICFTFSLRGLLPPHPSPRHGTDMRSMQYIALAFLLPPSRDFQAVSLRGMVLGAAQGRTQITLDDE